MSKLLNSYASLPENFYQRIRPSAGQKATLVAFNRELAEFLNLQELLNMTYDDLSRVFTGQELLEGSDPVAMAYAGHQFGHFVPQLGDGRAVLLGEAEAQDAKLYDLHLKGSGPTDFSRRGDGLSALGPVIREYILCEAMHHLGIPTTRALAALETGEQVQREESLPGGIFLRVARSHIRVGTFEYFSSQNQIQDLKTLTDYAIERHDPDLVGNDDKYNLFFERVCFRKLDLVASWMRVGFIHGVMNTDNTSIAGETIDYGPCAFMDEYKKDKVFSSIDHRGRYAYCQQGSIAIWNLSILANALFPLLKYKNETEEECIQRLQDKFEEMQKFFNDKYLSAMTSKLGIFDPKQEDIKLLHEVLDALEEGEQDFTVSFRKITNENFDDPDIQAAIRKRQSEQPQDKVEVKQLMEKSNPVLVPRNHQVERAIQEANNSKFDHFHHLNKAFETPYLEVEEHKYLEKPPQPNERVTQTFCGT